jgi:PHD-finger
MFFTIGNNRMACKECNGVIQIQCKDNTMTRCASRHVESSMHKQVVENKSTIIQKIDGVLPKSVSYYFDCIATTKDGEYSLICKTCTTRLLWKRQNGYHQIRTHLSCKRHRNVSMVIKYKARKNKNHQRKRINANKKIGDSTNDKEAAKIPVYCICRMPDNDIMVQCDGCNEWFHITCIGLTEQTIPDGEWSCGTCTLQSIFNGIAAHILVPEETTVEHSHVHWKKRILADY